MSYDSVFSSASGEFAKATSHLKDEFGRLQIGRASAALVEDIHVEVYGATQPLKSLASISIPEPRLIQIQPWDKGNLGNIERAIVGIGTGLNPINDGSVVRINIPPLSEERRADLTKIVKKLAEDARISVRNARHDAHNELKKMKNDGELTEDDLRDAEKDLQSKVDAVNKEIEDLMQAKEKDVMTV